MKSQEIGRLSSSFNEDLANMRDSLQDKGYKYFQRPMALGLLLILACYQLLYRAPVVRLKVIESELVATRATVKYAATYKDLRERLQILYSMLPTAKDPEEWLRNAIRESLREEGIVSNSLSSPRSNRVEGYRFLSITVTCEATYKDLATWIARLERGAALIYVESYKLAKKKAPIGMNTAEITITTAISDGAEGGTP